MAAFNSNEVINGTFGAVWMNGEQLLNVKSFEVKVSINYDTINVNGDLWEDQKETSRSVSGTMVLHKVDSTVAKMYRSCLADGIAPDIKLVGQLADPQGKGAERIAVYGVKFEEIGMKFENARMTEEEVPFKAKKIEYIDLI